MASLIFGAAILTFEQVQKRRERKKSRKSFNESRYAALEQETKDRLERQNSRENGDTQPTLSLDTAAGGAQHGGSERLDFSPRRSSDEYLVALPGHDDDRDRDDRPDRVQRRWTEGAQRPSSSLPTSPAAASPTSPTGGGRTNNPFFRDKATASSPRAANDDNGEAAGNGLWPVTSATNSIDAQYSGGGGSVNNPFRPARRHSAASPPPQRWAGSSSVARAVPEEGRSGSAAVEDDGEASDSGGAAANSRAAAATRREGAAGGSNSASRSQNRRWSTVIDGREPVVPGVAGDGSGRRGVATVTEGGPAVRRGVTTTTVTVGEVPGKANKKERRKSVGNWMLNKLNGAGDSIGAGGGSSYKK